MFGFEIQETLGVAAEEILARGHNLSVGVSDTPWFNGEGRLESLILWALEHTREKLLVWIPGRMYASNYFHIRKFRRSEALRLGFVAEDRFRARVEAAVRDHLRAGSSATIDIVGYDGLLTPEFVYRRSVLYRCFSEQDGFYRRVMEVADEYLQTRGRTVSEKLVEAVAVYQLQEMPMFIAPVRIIGKETAYTTTVYPGMGKFDLLAHDLTRGSVFPELTAKLGLTEPMGIASVKPKD